MGARQSVAQPPRQRTQTVGNSTEFGTASSSGHSNGGAASANSPFTNGHTLGEPSTSGIRSGLVIPQPLTSNATVSTNTNSQGPRPRQTRSRSVPMPPLDTIRGAGSSTGQQSNQQQPQQRHQLYRPHHYPIVARDQSSDSSTGGENDGTAITTGIPSLDRLLRLNSAVAVGQVATTSGTGTGATAVWLPSLAFRHYDVKCPVCSKMIPSDDVEYHLVVCLTRPRIAYNEDVLAEDKGECVICFEEMLRGDTIARLPCLCVYHKGCIDSWFKVRNSCPEHPGDE